LIELIVDPNFLQAALNGEIIHEKMCVVCIDRKLLEFNIESIKDNCDEEAFIMIKEMFSSLKKGSKRTLRERS
jgi:hypothetical protein